MSRRYEAPHPLFGCQLKLDRAYEHTDALNSAVEGFLWRKPHEAAIKRNHQRPEYVAWMKVRDTPPLWWSVVIGDIVHNLRSALDHLAYQLVIANEKTPGGKTAYPIFSIDPLGPEADKRSRDSWKNMTKGIHADDVATIKRTQPYSGRYAADYPHPLFILNRLSNRDKHKELQLTASVLVDSWFSVEAVRDVELGATEFGHYGPFEHGSVVAVCPIRAVTGNYPEVHMESQLSHGIAFPEGSPASLEGREIMETLMWLNNHVHDVIHEFATLSPRFNQDNS